MVEPMPRTQVSPELADRICTVFQALHRSENAAAMIGAILALRDVLCSEHVELADFGRWVKDHAEQEAVLLDVADGIRWKVLREVDAAARAEQEAELAGSAYGDATDQN